MLLSKEGNYVKVYDLVEMEGVDGGTVGVKQLLFNTTLEDEIRLRDELVGIIEAHQANLVTKNQLISDIQAL